VYFGPQQSGLLINQVDNPRFPETEGSWKYNPYTFALIPKGIKAGDLFWGCQGPDICDSWVNYFFAPKSVGSQTINRDPNPRGTPCSL
jgi:hypothetical protein